MKYLKIGLLIACAFMYNQYVWADKANVRYNEPANQAEQRIKNNLKSSGVIKQVTAFINTHINLPEPFYFDIGGEDGPLYDPEINTVIIPYAFITEVSARFKDANYSAKGISVTKASMGALKHTLLHEFSHALIAMYALPVLGKEEDAADTIASLLLIENFDQGTQAVISAADLFKLESQDIETFIEDDFWGEHSLDIQRYYSTLCLVYGSQPEAYSYIKNKLDLPDERADLCIEEYDNAFYSWFTLMQPYLKQS